MNKLLAASFGPFKHPYTKKVQMHKGLDIVAETGTEIMASKSGTNLYSDI